MLKCIPKLGSTCSLLPFSHQLYKDGRNKVLCELLVTSSRTEEPINMAKTNGVTTLAEPGKLSAAHGKLKDKLQVHELSTCFAQTKPYTCFEFFCKCDFGPL